MSKKHIKILMTENQFQNLINEDRGVNRASISYSNTILDAIEPYITNSLKTKKSDTFNIKIPLIILAFVSITAGYFLTDIKNSYQIEQWIAQYNSKVSDWFEVVSFFDAYNSLGNYVFNHPKFI